MSHITKEEYLSAFVDGEAGSFEQHRICDQLVADDAMREKLANFALMGAMIQSRTQVSAVASSTFLSGIQDAIAEDEPLSQVEGDQSTVIDLGVIKVKKKRVFPKQAFGYAVAASVAAVAAISFQNHTTSPGLGEEIETAALSKPINISSMLPSGTPSFVKKTPEADYFTPAAYKAPDTETRGVMNKYVAHHLHYASSSTLMPRVRAVSYSTDF